MCSIPYVTTSQINNIDYCVSQHYLKHTMLQSKRTIDPTQNSMKTVNKTSRRIRKFFSRPTLGNAATSCKHTLAHTHKNTCKMARQGEWPGINYMHREMLNAGAGPPTIVSSYHRIPLPIRNIITFAYCILPFSPSLRRWGPNWKSKQFPANLWGLSLAPAMSNVDGRAQNSSFKK